MQTKAQGGGNTSLSLGCSGIERMERERISPPVLLIGSFNYNIASSYFDIHPYRAGNKTPVRPAASVVVTMDIKKGRLT